MFIPIRTDSPLRTTPYMNWALIAANVVMFVVQKRLWPDDRSPYALSPQSPDLIHFFTYAFLHGDIMHLLGNMLFLYIFGNNVNDKMGHTGYLGFYLAGAVSAGIGYVLWSSGRVPVVGASGAIAAVTGAYLILFPRAHITLLYFFFLIGTFELASVWFIVGFFVYDLVYLSMQDGVAHVAHVGGTVFGAALCYVMLWAHLLPRDQFDVVALVKQWHRRRQYRDAVSGGWNPYLAPVQQAPAAAAGGFGGIPDPRTGRPPPPSDPRVARVMDLRSAIADAIAAHDHPKAAQLYVELKTIDPHQVLPRQAQLDVANQLANQQLYPQAAEAYESFLRNYPKFEQIEQVELMLGIIYARYLTKYARAKEVLLKATARLHTDRELAMARSELERIEPLLAAGVAGR